MENYLNNPNNQFCEEDLVKFFQHNSEPNKDVKLLIQNLMNFEFDKCYDDDILSLSSLSIEDYPDVMPAIYYLIWSTSNYKKQVDLINKILNNTNRIFHSMLFHYTVLKFKEISTDRKDKFFYILKKCFTCVRLSYILNIKDLEVLGYILGLITDRSLFLDWDDEVFVKFVSKCKPFLVETIYKFRISESLVRKYLDQSINPKNKDVLYSFFK